MRGHDAHFCGVAKLFLLLGVVDVGWSVSAPGVVVCVRCVCRSLSLFPAGDRLAGMGWQDGVCLSASTSFSLSTCVCVSFTQPDCSQGFRAKRQSRGSGPLRPAAGGRRSGSWWYALLFHGLVLWCTWDMISVLFYKHSFRRACFVLSFWARALCFWHGLAAFVLAVCCFEGSDTMTLLCSVLAPPRDGGDLGGCCV